MANLFQTQPYYPSVDSNQQAYNNWQNSLLQSANMAQNLHPETLAGMWGGTALGAILGRNFYNYLHPKKIMAVLHRLHQNSRNKTEKISMIFRII